MTGANHQAANNSIPAHDRTMAEAFLAKLDPNAEKYNFQFIRDADQKRVSKIYHFTFEETWRVVQRLNTSAEGIGVFVLTNDQRVQLPGTLNFEDPDAPRLVLPPPAPDRGQIEMFVRALFKHATTGNWVSLRAFPDQKGRNKSFRITTHKLNGNLNELIDQAFRDAELAAHAQEKIVFCPPVATFANNKQTQEVNLVEGLVLSVECDQYPQAARRKLEKLLGPATIVVESGGVWVNPETGESEPRLHLYFLLKIPTRGKEEHRKLKQARKLATKIVGGDPSNVPLVHPIRWPGSLHRKGEPKLCRIIGITDNEIDLDAALELLQEAVEEPAADPEPSQDARFPPLPLEPILKECGWLRHVHDTGGADQSEVLWRDALRVSMFLEDGKKWIHEFGNQHEGYDPEDTEAKFDRAYQDKVEKDLGFPKCQTICDDGSTHCATCPHLAAGKSPLNLALQYLYAQGRLAPPYSEEALALAFAERHADTLRHVAAWNRWFVWDGTCWRRDETRQAFTLARKIGRETAAKSPAGERKRLASAKTRAAVVSLAGEDPRLVATTEQWDADPWLLNTPDGVVDLRTGKMREHRAADYMTMQTTVSPSPAPARMSRPRWMTFLQEVTDGDEALQSYLQRVSGYCLTGVTTEHQLFFFHGSGRNGKGVWVLSISGIWGDYHRSTAIETFTVTRSERHPTELAGLRGARLVTATETEEGRRWAEARIKEITGGDKISARLMRQDFFDFFPQFKPLFLGNHMPVLRTVNKAIAARFNRIPFAVTIPKERINKNLAEELKAEWPGILAWAIEGCLEWQRIGLCPPQAVTAATESYLESEDIIGEWLDECCIRDANAWEGSTALFLSWKGWAAGREEWIGSEKTFTTRLEERGEFKRKKNPEKTKRGFIGLRLKTPTERQAEKGTADSAAKVDTLIPFPRKP